MTKVIRRNTAMIEWAERHGLDADRVLAEPFDVSPAPTRTEPDRVLVRYTVMTGREGGVHGRARGELLTSEHPPVSPFTTPPTMTQPATHPNAYTDADVHAAVKATRRVKGGTIVGLLVEKEVRLALDAVAPAIAARALREAAESTERETVCCDEYEAFKAGVPRPKYAHHICYWGAAHAEALRARADEIEAGR